MAVTSPPLSTADNYTQDIDHCDDGYSNHDVKRTPLDKTIDKIGMGNYQWALLSLCGFGWLADNMWLQAVAIILPRVQRHYDVSNGNIGILSASVFAGMMIGAVLWGTCSDLLGRIAAFNGTLILTSVFGVLASFSRSFTTLCTSMFLLGSAVGGSMPTDGTLLLEHMPKDKEYLVTALSIFFSFGSVIAALVAIYVVPNNSCLSISTTELCDPDQDNRGWQYLLQILAAITLIMFLSRIAFFRLYESPRYLVHAGRPQEAIVSLQKISEFNGEEMALNLEDVEDETSPIDAPDDLQNSQDAHDFSKGHGALGSFGLGAAAEDQIDYHTLRETPSPAEWAEGTAPGFIAVDPGHSIVSRGPTRASPSRGPPLRNARGNSILFKWISGPVNAWLGRLSSVLSPEWRRTTILVWAAWFSMSLAYTMFNVYLPKLLESRNTRTDTSNQSLESTMWDIVIFTLGGCPGALLGAYLQELRLGRRLSLALSTFVTAILCIIFIIVHSPWAVRMTTVGIGLSASTMWAILYGWTPAIFATSVRGTACGAASALSRAGGVVAPLIGGWLLAIDPSFPVYASIVVFLVACLSVLGLSEHGSRQSHHGYHAIHA